MPWAGTIKALVRAPTDKRLFVVTISYSNGTLSEDHTYTLPAAAVQATVQGEMAQYEATDTFIANLPAWAHVGQVVPPIAAPTPTPAELARQAWFTAYRKYKALQQWRADGHTGVTDVMVSNALAAWNALPFDTSYGDTL